VVKGALSAQHPHCAALGPLGIHRAIAAIIAMQPTIITSGITASSTHQVVRAAVTTITTAAATTSSKPIAGIPRLKHIIRVLISVSSLIETTEGAPGIHRQHARAFGNAGAAGGLIPGLADERATLVI